MMGAGQEQLLDLLKSELASPEYSDLLITCGSNSYKVHKMIVCRRSSFFATAVGFGGKETHENKIHLPEDEPAIIKLFIQYLYEAEYDPKLPRAPEPTDIDIDPQNPYGMLCRDKSHLNDGCFKSDICAHTFCGNDCNNADIAKSPSACRRQKLRERLGVGVADIGTADHLILHSKLYAIADKYDVAGLKELALEKFARACYFFWDDDAFPIAARHVFSSTYHTDMGLRNVVGQVIDKGRRKLIDKPAIEDFLKEPEASELTLHLLKMNIVRGESDAPNTSYGYQMMG